MTTAVPGIQRGSFVYTGKLHAAAQLGPAVLYAALAARTGRGGGRDHVDGLPRIGQLVQSRAGRDSGTALVVVGLQDGRHVLVADGALRSVRRPKLKSVRHLAVGTVVHPGIAAGRTVSDAEIRAWLRRVAETPSAVSTDGEPGGGCA